MPGSQFKYTDKRISGARDLHKLMKKGSVPVIVIHNPGEEL